MLSYIIPSQQQQQQQQQQQKTPPRTLNLNHNLNLNKASSTATAAGGVGVVGITKENSSGGGDILGVGGVNSNRSVAVNSNSMALVAEIDNKRSSNNEKQQQHQYHHHSHNEQQFEKVAINKNGNNVMEIICDETIKLLSNERAQMSSPSSNNKNSSISLLTKKTPDQQNLSIKTISNDDNTINTNTKIITTSIPGGGGGIGVSDGIGSGKKKIKTTLTIHQLQKNTEDKSDYLTTRVVEGGGDGESGDIHISSTDDVCGANNLASSTDDAKNQTKKSKISKIGAKNTTLKRVSFGSSKGSMVETLIFETPTPLPEHAERVFGYPADSSIPNSSISSTSTIIPTQYHHHHHHPHHQQQQQQQQHGHRISSSNIGAAAAAAAAAKFPATTNINKDNNNTYLDDSGIDLQEESERSKVRVTFFQSNKPQQVSPPDSYLFYSEYSSLPILPDSSYTFEGSSGISNNNTNRSGEMAVESTAQISYDRQISTESGWDNPFRPGGDLSREADEIVNLIKGGKPITPTGDANTSIANGKTIENGKAVLDGATKSEASHLQSTPAQNGTKSSQQSKLPNDSKSQSQPTQVSNQVVPGPTSASHVVIQDKKKKKCNCCVIQ